MAPVANCLGCAEGYGRHAIDCKHNTDTQGGMMQSGTRTTIYLKRETAQLLEALTDELGMNTSHVVAHAIEHYAAINGYRLVPARVERITADEHSRRA